MRHSLRTALALVATMAFASPQSAAAQDRLPVLRARTPAQAVQHPLTPPPPPAVPAPPADGSRQSASDTFNELRDILNGLPPNVREVLALDPSLLDREDYLAPYPRLAEFLQQHPEVRRNPSFFFGTVHDDSGVNPRIVAIRTMDQAAAGLLVFAGVMLALWMITGVLRQLIDYRRWLRQSRVQADTSTKVLDRLSSNEDLLAYLQTPAGISLVQAAPALVEAPRAISAPFGRILWSVQAGIVLAAFGIGLRVAQGRVAEEIAPAFAVAGTVAFCVGVGFVVSAAVAWVITSRTDVFSSKA